MDLVPLRKQGESTKKGQSFVLTVIVLGKVWGGLGHNLFSKHCSLSHTYDQVHEKPPITVKLFSPHIVAEKIVTPVKLLPTRVACVCFCLAPCSLLRGPGVCLKATRATVIVVFVFRLAQSETGGGILHLKGYWSGLIVRDYSNSSQ